MIADRNRLKLFGLEKFTSTCDNIENQYLNLIYDPMFDHVVERWVYDKTSGLMEWKCAICGDKILVDKSKSEVENFVCEKCRKYHNSGNPLIDRRILDSRTKMFKYIESQLYEELEDKLKGGK